ncbi:UDP-2,4-diacetamido-2,4,6-trideoxy-beta-L-altropyranose hydrolase [Desulfolutivibrio sulfoxidireducens]|nr:UDP-2,4-diacetamido-2,4,6-trideoxy-beta-L-altropyranose hydrolase [Desulfolutivibrio sulfoxidireducens]
MNTMNINDNVFAVRVDAGERIGIGHLMRCLTIARRLRQCGKQVHFLLTPLPRQIEKLFQSYQFAYKYIHADAASLDDAAQTLSIVKELGASWLIVDGYPFGTEYQKRVYTDFFGLMLIDALGSPQHNYAHILLNPNIYAREEYYTAREPRTKLLLGLEYLPIRPEFTSYTPRQRLASQPLRNVLVSLGGSDPDNVTGAVIQFFMGFPAPLHCKIVLGPASQHVKMLEKMADSHTGRFEVLHSPDDIPGLMDWSDVAVLAGGSTVWEAFTMGVPCILLSYADNQLRVAPRLGELEYALYSGHFNGRLPTKFDDDMNAFFHNGDLRASFSARVKKLIDGQGSVRIVTEMLAGY